jgi:hypothetical protein
LLQSAYNLYFSQTLPKVKQANPTFTHIEAFAVVASNWKLSPLNPLNVHGFGLNPVQAGGNAAAPVQREPMEVIDLDSEDEVEVVDVKDEVGGGVEAGLDEVLGEIEIVEIKRDVVEIRPEVDRIQVDAVETKPELVEIVKDETKQVKVEETIQI